jgi:hypothetical protein
LKEADMLAPLPDVLRQIKESGRISGSDVLAIRKIAYPDGAIDVAEAGWLFELNDACTAASPEWQELFVEAITDFVVHQMEPQGYVSEANAKWVMDCIGATGVVGSAIEIELLVNILDKAVSCPPALAAFALAQVKHAVIEGSGPLRSGKTMEPGRVDAADVGLLRQILYAFGGGGNASVTREEAEILFDINDATAGAANAPAWNDLFAKAVASHLMLYSGYAPPSREDALRREKWLDDTSINIGGFFNRMVTGLSDIFRLYRPEAGALAEARTAESERVTAEEAQWLAARINRDGTLSDPERAVLTFIKKEAAEIHPALKPLLDKVA